MLLFEEPWITPHIFVYESGDAYTVGVRMPLGVDDRIFEPVAIYGDEIHAVDREGKSSQHEC